MFEAFRFIKRYRQRVREAEDRKRQDQREEREHQLAIVSTIVSKLAEAQSKSQDALIAIADAQRSQSEVMGSWFKSFHVDPLTSNAPHIMNDDEEVLEEQRRAWAMGETDKLPSDLPAEFQLAFSLEKMNQANLVDFDREGSDFK